jgi:hypothetical protein
MNARTAAEIALGVVGIYFVASSVPACVVSVGFALNLNDVSQRTLRWVGVVGAISTALSGGVLLLTRRSLSLWLCPSDSPSHDASEAYGVHAAALSVIGVLFLANGLEKLATQEILVGSKYQSSRSLDQYGPAIAAIAVGALLFLGTRGVLGLWRMARLAGRPKSSDN